MCALTTDVAIVDSFVTDGDTWRDHAGDVPTLEFYETDELANQLDNWFGPSVACLMAMCRAAGFARVELMHASGLTAGVACFRRWEDPPANPSEEAPELTAVMNNRTLGVNFYTRKEEYISCWFAAPREVAREELRLEVGGYGVPALYARPEANGAWMANFRLPPGLRSGWHDVRLRFGGSGFGRSFRIAVDMPATAESIEVKGACDARTFTPGEVAAGSFASIWVAGLPENADRANTRVWLGSTALRVEYVGQSDIPGLTQVNAAVPDRPVGDALAVGCGGVRSESYPIKVVSP